MFIVLLTCTIVGLASGQEVAFSAGLSHDQTIQHAENVAFDKIYTNIGGGYDSISGNFTCPLAGIYVFQFHTLAHQNKSSWLELYHDGNYVASIYGHTANDYASGGNSVVLPLNQRDRVYIKAVDNRFGVDTNMYGQPDEVYSTFSGYLIGATHSVIVG